MERETKVNEADTNQPMISIWTWFCRPSRASGSISRPTFSALCRGPEESQLELEDFEKVAGEAGEVSGGMERLENLVKDMRNLLSRAEQADAKIKHLGSVGQKDAGVQMLATAQEAGEALLELSKEIGELSPFLSEASMEVAESSLSLAARFASVPCALLLTDVALSCTLEASRLQHTGEALLEIRRDTTSTLHTLQANLSMAKILGTVDAETFKLSVGLVRKASSRMMASIKEVHKATTDALHRGHHCLIHARSVCRFSARRSSAEAPDMDLALEALEYPMREDKQMGQGGENQRNSEGKEEAKGQKGGKPSKQESQERQTDPVHSEGSGRSEPSREDLERERRRHNDRLLRQLDADVQGLQHRAKAMAKGREREESPGVLNNLGCFVAEVLSAATDTVLQDFNPDAQVFKAILAQNFAFVEVCGQEIAAPHDLRTQLMRYLVLVDSQAVLQGLQQAKERIRQSSRFLEQRLDREALSNVLEQHFELLSAAVVNARLFWCLEQDAAFKFSSIAKEFM